MNKLYLWGVIIIAAMLGATYLSVATSKGGLNNDIVNMLAVAGAAAIISITVFVVIKYVRQMQVDSATGELADENWDGIGEYKNELPTGWAVIFLLTMIWGMWYFTIGYPLNAYSQIGEYNEDVAVHNAKFEEKYKDITGDRLVEMGESVFLAECKVCHGLSADGIDGKAANLNKRLDDVAIKYVIANGANNFKTDYPGGMPPMMLSDPAQIDSVTAYITAGFPDGHNGAESFAMGGCTGCHGEKGEGIAFVGPKLDGFDISTVQTVLKDGKKGVIGTMPKFDKLNDKQKEAVGAYITSLSE